MKVKTFILAFLMMTSPFLFGHVADEITSRGNLEASTLNGVSNTNTENVVLTGTVATAVAKIGTQEFETLADAVAEAKSGDELVMLSDATLEAELTIPAGITLNGNGYQIDGSIVAAGDLTFAGHTKVTSFNAGSNKPVITIGEGACLEMNGTGRMVIGHGATFNINGTIADAKTAAGVTRAATDLTPSLIMPGASFTGAGVTFNVNNAYIKTTASYCSSSKSASGTFDFNIENSIWEQFGKLAFESQSTAATVDFELKNSVLTTTSHLVFGVSRGEIIIDNSYVNKGTSRQIENQSTMTVKNGSVVNGAVATSSNAKNPGTLIVDNATYSVTGEFSGSDLGTGTLIMKNGASFTAGSITKANIQIDAEGLAVGNEININAKLDNHVGTLEVINNNNLDAKIENGKIVLVEKPVAQIGNKGYTSLLTALSEAKDNETVVMNVDVELTTRLIFASYTNGKQVTLDGNGNRLYASSTNWGTGNGKHLINVNCDNVTLRNVVLDCNNIAEGANIYKAQNIVFDNVSIINKKGWNADLTVNGSTLTVENKLSASYVDIDLGSGVTTPLGIVAAEGAVLDTKTLQIDAAAYPNTNLDNALSTDGTSYYSLKKVDANGNLTGYSNSLSRLSSGYGYEMLEDMTVNSDVTLLNEGHTGTLNTNGHTLTIADGKSLTVNGALNVEGEGTIKGNIILGNSDASVSGVEGLEIKSTIEGAEVVYQDGKYIVAIYVAQVGDTKYDDLQEAIVAAAPAGTVEIINDVTVDKWIMFSERLGIGSGQIITIEKIDGLTINGNNHSLTINSIESASNGNRLFYDATKLNIKDLTINYAEGVVGGIGLTSGTISNVTFNGGVGVLPGTGEITIIGCNFNTSGSAIYNEEDRDKLVVTGNTFNTAEGQYAIYLRGNTTFTDNTVITGKVNVTNSGTGLISGNDFGTERFKVYNAATATIEDNKINNLVFNDESVVCSTFGENELSKEAQAVLDKASFPVAQIGTTKYGTLQEAFNAVQNGEIIVLLTDIELTKAISFTKDITFTIDGKGKTIKPDVSSTETNSAFNFGQGSDATVANKNYTIKDIVFDSWTTDHVVRLQGVNATVENCTFQNCKQQGANALGLLTLTFCEAKVEACTFKDNECVKAIDVNSWGDNSEKVSNIDECIFNNNTCSGPAVVLKSDGTINLKNSDFIKNTVTTTGNAATVYVGFGSGNTVEGCYFENNTITTTHTTTKRIASAIFCDGDTVKGNVFGEGNTATRNDETITTAVAVGAYYGAANISENYWGGEEPEKGANYTVEYSKEVAMESYYTTVEIDEEGNITLGGLVELPKGDQPIGYVSETTIWGETWSNARESYVIKVKDAEGNVMGTSTLNPELYTFNGNQAPTWHISFDPSTDNDTYWIQEWTTAPSIDNMPAKVALWVDGVEVNEGQVKFNGPDDINKMYAATADAEGKLIRFYNSIETIVNNDENVNVVLVRDVTGSFETFRNVTLYSGVEGAAITNTYDSDYTNFNNVIVKNGVTLNINNVLSSADTENTSVNTIEGTLNVAEVYYHSKDAKTNIQNGGKVTTGGMTIVRYNYKPESGIYIYGDGDDTTVEFSCQGDAIGAYSGTFYAENAVVETKGLRLDYKKDNSEEPNECAQINAQFINSKLDVSAELRLYKDAALTLNGATVTAGKVQIRQDATPTLNVNNSTIKANSVENLSGATWNAVMDENGYVTFVRTGLAGDGSEANPYLINNVDDLVFFRDEVNAGNNYQGKYVKLTDDIDLEEADWTPIGNSTNPFMGTFDGNEKTIHNVWAVGDGNMGFFGQVAKQTENVTGTVKNVTFNNVTIIGQGNATPIAGVIAVAPTGARINNVHLTGKVTIQGYRGVGGIVGNGFPIMDGCSVIAEGTITATYWGAGGILGFSSDKGAKVTNSVVKSVGNGLTIHGNSGGVGAVHGSPHGAKVDGAEITDVIITSNNNYCMGYVDAGGNVNNVEVSNVKILVNGEEIIGVDAIASIDNTPYFSLQDAFNAGGNITVLRNVNLTETVKLAAGKTVTLDLNGKTIDYNPEVWTYGAANSGTALLTVDFGGDLTIEDKSAEKTGTIDASYREENWDNYTYDVYGAVMMTAAGDNTENGTAKLTVNGGTLKGFFAAVAGNRNRDNTEITINDGYLTVEISDKFSTTGIEHPMNGKLTINGGKIEGMDGISFRSGTLVITGGTIIGNAPESAFEPDEYWDNNFAACTGHALQIVNRANNEPTNETPNVTITGGTFIAENTTAVASYASSKGDTPDTQIVNFVSGGTFNGEIEQNLLAEGYELVQNEDGTYGVVESLLKGKGTEDNPYLIENLEDLIAFRNSVNAGETKFNAPGVWVALADNIDMASVDWSVNIGDDCNSTFDGIFDGRNHTIYNLNSIETAQKGDGYVCTGLFGAIYGEAVVKNLTIENVNINTGEFTGNNVAAVVGFAYQCKGSIENVKVIGDINIYAPGITGVGAIVGYDYYSPSLTVENCEVEGGTYVGGLIGNENSSIVGKSYVGGLIGYASTKASLVSNTIENIDIEAVGSVAGVAGIMLTGASATENTVNNVNITVTGELWQNSAAIVAGTMTGATIEVSETTFENVTVNGVETDAIVGGVLVEKPTEPIAKVEARIGNKYYPTLQAAFNAANDETVTLIADTELSEMITITNGKTVTLDLNGKTITTATDAIAVDGGELIITDSSTDASGSVVSTDATDGEVIMVKNGGKFKLVEGNIKSATYGIYIYSSGGNVEVAGGNVELTGENKDGMAIAVGTDAASLANINGGTIKANGVNWPIYTWGGQISITGGTFDFEPNKDYIAYGYGITDNQDGTYTVTEVDPMIFIGTTAYYTLDEALEAATENDNITITEAGKYYWTTSREIPAGVTIEGDAEGVIVDGNVITINATILTVKNIDFNAINKAGYVTNGKALTMTFDNCSFTGVYAFHVDAAAENSVFTFNNCVFNGFTTFASSVDGIKVNGGEINNRFVVRQDAILNNVVFAEDEVAGLQIGTSDVVTNINVSMTACTVKDTNEDDTVPSIEDLVVNHNVADGSGNTVVVDGVIIYGGVAKIENENETKRFATLADAVAAAENGATIQLIWAEGNAPIAMNASLYGKDVTITGTATVDWSKDFLFVGRGGKGNATLIFDNANLTSASNSSSYGIHVSGREKNTNNKYDGTLIIKNSTIELDYLINKGAITLDNSTLTVKNGFSIGGRPASETESGVDATATISLNNGSKVIVNNHNGMGLGYEAIGVMNIDATSTFETTKAFLITAKGTLNNAGIVSINGALTNKGTINFTDLGATLTTTTEDLNINDLIDNIEYKIVYEDETYKYIQMPSQEQSLVAGWNWYSTYLDITLNDLTNALGDNGISIKNFNGVNVENLGNNLWLGQLNEINPSEMYLIETTTECDLKLAADLVNPNDHIISLNAGWSWIGYPSNQGVNINVALENLDANPGDIIKSLNDGYAEYAFGLWLGTLNTMVPGVGYKYNNKSGEAKTFYYNIEATRGAVEANVTAENNYWTPNATKYPHNMTMTAVVDGLTNGNYEVAAFVNGEVRGSARPIYVEALDAHIFFLTIHGEDVEEMSFRLYDIDTDTEYALSDRINYSNDAMLGSVNEPYVFSRGTTGIGEAALSEINIYPNPTTTGSTIRLQNTCDKVEVYNAIGVLVAEYHNVDSIDALETAGIYVIRITNDGNTQNCRLVVR